VSPVREPLPTRVMDTPVLPDVYHAAVANGLAQLGIELDAAARAVIDGHVRLLLAWTQAINLTAIREPGAVAIGHVLDSLSAVPTMRALGASRFLDLGSGGGFPGVPLAAALPGTDAVLVEPIGKKARFLQTALAATGLERRVEVVASRAEALAADPRQRGAWPAVTARAVARLDELVEIAFPLLSKGGSVLAWKRGDLEQELPAGERAVAALGGGELRVVAVELAGLHEHCLVVATRTGRLPDQFPRDPATRRRRPL
jgi:16S rRNA (guanine527-N7)-methyltransferase